MCSSFTTIFLLASSVWNLDVRNISRRYVSVLTGFSDVAGPVNHVSKFLGVLQPFFFCPNFAFVMISYINFTRFCLYSIMLKPFKIFFVYGFVYKCL